MGAECKLFENPTFCIFDYVINYRRTLFGDYRHYINIESDFVTCNSNVVFRRLSTIMFLYQDRHGNWVIGNYDSSSS